MTGESERRCPLGPCYAQMAANHSFRSMFLNPTQGMMNMPCIRRLRIPVAMVVGMVSEGMTEAEILKAYPDLELEDIREALRYAAEAVRERELPVAGS